MKTNSLLRMKKNGSLLAEVFDSVKVESGVTLSSLSQQVSRYFKHSNVVFGTIEVGFPGICCVSPRNTICHGIPDSRLTETNDLVKLDIVLKIGNLYVDSCWTYLLGSKYKSIWFRSYYCFVRIINLLTLSDNFEDWIKESQVIVKSMGLKIVREFSGHGIGEKMHQDPNVNFEDLRGKVPQMTPFTIEPIFTSVNSKYKVRTREGHEYEDSNANSFVMFEHTVVKWYGDLIILTYNNLDRKMNWMNEKIPFRNVKG